MQPSAIDISVLILFFNRPEPLKEVFEQVRLARPTRLFLYQDGPRSNADMHGIEACRYVVSKIDWECEVHQNYQTINAGCDPSEFLAQKWAFSLTDKCIVLEDDDVPSQSFFPFCKEMLDRYENDERITMIAGFNTDEDSTPYFASSASTPSYFFTRAFSIWGWASWARVINNWDGTYDFVKNVDKWNVLQQKSKQYRQRKEMISLCRQHAQIGKEYYETIFWAYMTIHDGLAIMPTVNMINNIGLTEGTHYATQLQLMPRRLRKQFEMERHNLDFPLKHPVKIEECPAYQERYYLLNAWNNPWRKIQYSLEELLLNLQKGNFANIKKAMIARIKKTFTHK